MSLDTIESHKLFAEKYKLNFPLIADTGGEIAGKFGVPVRGVYAARITFVIGPDGKIFKVFPKVDPRGHADEVLAVLATLESG